MGWTDLIPALVTGGTALIGGLAGGDSLTGHEATASRSGVMPSTAEGRQLLNSLQNDILGAKPMNLSVKGANIPILDPFLKAKARTAKNLMYGSVGGTPADGGILSGMAPAMGAAAKLLEGIDDPMVNDESWDQIMSWVPDASDPVWEGWLGGF